jgi:uncharacterized membrane protein YheB (UPF0754 family)
MVRMFMGDVDKMISNYIDKDGDKLFDEMIDEFQKTGLEKLNIREIVKERIDELDFIEFEKIIFGLMSKELKHIEIIGLFLGALIGILQFVIVTFI